MGVSVGAAGSVGVRVAVNRGRCVLVGVGVMLAEGPRLKEQPRRSKARRAIRAIKNSKRFLIKKRTS
jgi:hypothetical protein